MTTYLSRTSLLALVASVTACGPAPAAQAPVVNTAGVGPAQVAAPCPAGDALLATAARSWGKASVAGIYAECVALRVGGETLWFLEGSWDGGETQDGWVVGLWSSLVTPAGEVRWADGTDDLPPSAIERGGNGNLQAIDLDGDGSDELVYEASFSHGGYEDSGLIVLSVNAAGVASVTPDQGLSLLSDNSAAVSDPAEVVTCEGKYQIVEVGDGTRRIEITYTGQCDPPGTRAWVLAGPTLTEIER